MVFAAISGLTAFKLIPTRFVDVAVAGVAFFVVLLCGAEFAILILIAVSSTLFDVTTLPYLFGFSSTTLTMFILLGLVLVNYLSGGKPLVRTPLDWPIILFVAAAIISFWNAKYNLGTVSKFRTPLMQSVLAYLVFFAVINLIKTRQQLIRLVGGMFVLATITAGFMVAQQAVGTTVTILPGQQQVYNTTVLGAEVNDVARVSLDGASIVYVMLLPALILHVTPEWLNGRKWLSFIPVVLFPLAIAFTFDRNMWVGAIGAGVLLVLLFRLHGKHFVFLILTVAIGVILLGSLLNAYIPRIGTVAQGLEARFSSLFAGDELVYDSSTQGRLKENEYALAKIREYPILGIGPMADYYDALYKNTYYVHNAYLWLLLDFGAVGFFPFLWFSVVYLIDGLLSRFSIQDPVLKGFTTGFTLSYVAILISCVATPKLFESYYVSLIGVLLGINMVSVRLEQGAVEQLKDINTKV